MYLSKVQGAFNKIDIFENNFFSSLYENLFSLFSYITHYLK